MKPGVYWPKIDLPPNSSYPYAWSLLPDVVIYKYKKEILELPLPGKWQAPYSIAIITRRDRSKNQVLLKLKTLLRNEFRNILN